MFRSRTRLRVAVALTGTALVAAGWMWWAWLRRPPMPQRTLVIGYKHNPPYQVRPAVGVHE